MGWYGFFSLFYDGSVAKYYLEQREQAAEALRLEPGQRVLDLPCGTGLSLPAIMERLGPQGEVVGVDRSSGMLRKARKRAAKAGWPNVRFVKADARSLDAATLQRNETDDGFDRILCFLGLSVFTDYAAVFDRLHALLRPGGRFVLVDVHTDKLGFQGRMVNLTARADLRRRVWEPLEAKLENFELERFHAHKQHGGDIVLAAGHRAA